MGTTKCGRYINTKGSGHTPSEYALIHSNEGTYTHTTGTNAQLRLASGCHGQAGLKLLQKYGIKYTIDKVFPNGVRVGNILEHKRKAERSGSKHAWFPETWTVKDIRRAGEHVSGLRKNRHIPDGKIAWGIYKNVRVGIIRTHGKISTIFPDCNQYSVINRRHR